MEKVEIKSEKVRTLMGKIPPIIIRMGNICILGIIIILFISSCIIKMPTTVSADAIARNKQGYMKIYIQSISEVIETPIHKGCIVKIYNQNRLLTKGFLSDEINTIVITENGQKLEKEILVDEESTNRKINIKSLGECHLKATIEIKKESLIERIIGIHSFTD
ncbi:hypothetical protein [Bacteroides sp.]|uniref:hypothetical protein n=1 Tax=Bacteroides sp. TaxID=29523 RepID=UPI00260B4FD0|nr:hypothetical protein [Bacteroides sp.]